MNITGGRVAYSRTVQPQQYESKRGECELSFVLDEGEELGNALDEVTDLVMEHALGMVGLRRKTD